MKISTLQQLHDQLIRLKIYQCCHYFSLVMSGGWCFSITLNPVLPWSLPESGYWPLVSRGWADKQKIPLTWLRSNWYNEFSHSSLPFQTELHILCKIQISSTGNIQSFMDVIKPTNRIVISQVVVISATIPKIGIIFFFQIKNLTSWWKKSPIYKLVTKEVKYVLQIFSMFLSPSGDLGIGLVWDNPTGSDPTATFRSDCWNPVQTELNYLWWFLSCS